METIAVILIVAVVLFFAARSIYRTVTGKASACSGGCAGCKLIGKCELPQKEDEPEKKSSE